jgi:hypothetical protein
MFMVQLKPLPERFPNLVPTKLPSKLFTQQLAELAKAMLASLPLLVQ